eukprot:TRINITY_DN854_c0_g1_i1.p2 TRINITY_DN854_c0_g1~~TRINITY_DN854_c0_g1_i1.p2  ORF type:complete len:157 (+),score=19.06 TRINITY_DN854_c0_g1_i1:256-726(+)
MLWDAFVVFGLLVVVEVVVGVVQKWLFLKREGETEISAQIGMLRRDAEKVNTPRTFVKYARIQRKIKALEKIQEEQAKKRQVSSIVTRILMFCFRRSLKYFAALFVIYLWWDTPIFLGSPATFFPFSSLFAYPHGAGAVGIVFWVVMSRQVISQIL